MDRPVVDLGANCGNLSSAVGPFAVDEGLCPRADGPALVRIHNTNTGGLIHARFAVRDGRAETRGDLAIPGVAGTGAPIRLDFLDPGGARTGRLLPTGNPVDEVELEAPAGSGCHWWTRPTRPSSWPPPSWALTAPGRRTSWRPGRGDGPAGPAAPPGRGADGAGRGARGRRAGQPPYRRPRPPRPFRTLDGRLVAAADHDVGVRMLSMERAHRAVPVTGALCLGVACRVPGTVAQAVAATPAAAGDPVRVGNPSGVVQVAAEVAEAAGGWRASSASLYRTARSLMRGAVAVPPG